MELAAELTFRAELDVDALIKTESNEIQWLFHCALFLARHSPISRFEGFRRNCQKREAVSLKCFSFANSVTAVTGEYPI